MKTPVRNCVACRRAARPLIAALALWAAGGCNSAREALEPRTQVLDTSAIEALLRRAPVAPDQALRAETLLQSNEFSAHLLQYRTGEARHVHRTHDLTVFIHGGLGEFEIGGRHILVSAGDVLHIPRGVPHGCTNTGDRPLAAVLIFTPPFDMKDSAPLSPGEPSYERR